MARAVAVNTLLKNRKLFKNLATLTFVYTSSVHVGLKLLILSLPNKKSDSYLKGFVLQKHLLMYM